MSYTLINNGDTGLSIRNTLNNALQDLNNGKYGLAGTQYIFVSANGTPQENAAKLQAAYNQAKTMSPTAGNRITVIAAPGEYQFPSTFVMDTEYIDLVSLTGNPDVFFYTEGDPVTLSGNNISEIIYSLLVNANNVYVKGISGKVINSPNWNFWWGDSNYRTALNVGNNLPMVIFENCISGKFSFGSDYTFGGSSPIIVSSTFINCKTEDYSVAMYGIASGTFINHTGIVSPGENYGYVDNYLSSGPQLGAYGNATGYFENCKVGFQSFAYDFSPGNGNASGTFINCKSAGFSFGRVASGTFINCQGGERSFGGVNAASGTFTNCIGGGSSFGSVNAASGTFTNCIGGGSSFGGESGSVLVGRLFYCRLTQGTFQTVSGGGKTVLCIDGNNQVNTQN